MGVVVRRYIDFLILLIPIYSSCICSFLQQYPYFLFIFLCFSFLVYIIYTRFSTSGGYVLCQVYSNSGRQTDTFLNVFTYIIFIFTVYFKMSSGN